MTKKYDVELKKQSAHAYMQGTNYSQLEKEYGVAKSTLSGWVKKYSEECKYTSKSQPDNPYAKEIHDLNKKLPDWIRRTFSEKSRSILRKGTRLVIYQFIDKNKHPFDPRWLFRHFNMAPNHLKLSPSIPNLTRKFR